jgi:hypothetical protein
MGSPRAADCFDIYKASPKAEGKIFRPFSLLVFYPHLDAMKPNMLV